MVTKVASDATHVIKDKVGGSVATTMITEFNREQEEFIKSKGTKTCTRHLNVQLELHFKQEFGICCFEQF
jgi:hypothetical protein